MTFPGDYVPTHLRFYRIQESWSESIYPSHAYTIASKALSVQEK